MAKTSGGVRTLKSGSREYNHRMREVEEMRSSGKYSSVEFDKAGGGYVAIEKSAAKHKPEEIEAARILARNGYKVVLNNEAGKGNKVKTPDGQLFSVSFEQRTPTKDSGSTIKNALKHAKDKGADIALIYSKDRAFSRKAVEDGIRLWEKSPAEYRFKMILVVADNGHIHKHIIHLIILLAVLHVQVIQRSARFRSL